MSYQTLDFGRCKQILHKSTLKNDLCIQQRLSLFFDVFE